MKRTRLFNLVVSMALVLVSLSGCKSAPPPAVTSSIDDFIKAAGRASKYADEARAAQLAASELSDGAELRALLDKANQAARNAQDEAEAAAALQSKLDDFAAQQQAKKYVEQAQQSAEEAAAQAAAINRALMIVRKTVINARMDDVTSGIVQRVEFPEGSSQQELTDLLDEIVQGSFCDLLVETVASGEAPTGEDVLAAVQENAEDSVLKISEVEDVVSEELLEVFNQWVIGQPIDELELFKEACSSVMQER